MLNKLFMELTEDYIKENIDVIQRNFKNRRFLKRNPRWEVILPFCSGARKILSVGSGGVEPTIINATHAIDIHSLSGHYLRLLKWRGFFRVANCTDIPAPDKYFDVAVCSEVIEHLPELSQIIETFHELNRVAKRWIATTPANPLGPLNIEPTHKRFLDLETLKKLTSKYKTEVFREGNYNYVKKT
jgi:hypothetical protein